MNIINELDHLPTYFYTFIKGDKLCYALLGGQSTKRIDTLPTFNSLMHYHRDMLSLYENAPLSEVDKERLAKLLTNIRNCCIGRFEGKFTIKEQEQYLSTLPKEALLEIEQQIEMYKTARQYYRQYIYRK